MLNQKEQNSLQLTKEAIKVIETIKESSPNKNKPTILLTSKEAEQLIKEYATNQIINPSGTTITQLDFTENSKALLLQNIEDKDIRSIATSRESYPKDLFTNPNRHIRNAKVLNKKEEIKAIDKISKSKQPNQYFNQQKRDQILEKLKQSKERTKGVER